jgi:hypothetical protein
LIISARSSALPMSIASEARLSYPICAKYRYGLAKASAQVFCSAVLLFANAAGANEIVALVREDTGNAVADAVVIAVPEVAVKLPTPKPETMVQERKEFAPFVKAVLVGTPVQFPNKDDVLHHVYSFAPTKTFELKAYSGTPPEPVIFDKPGPVALGCNIHDWMRAYVYVSESPYFGITGPEGIIRLSRLPPGRYALRVWHSRLAMTEAATTQAVVVEPGKTAEMTWDLGLKRDVRVRRAPTASGGGYR